MNKKLAKRIGTRVFRARKRMGLSQEKFASLAGITRGFLSDLERGEALPSVETLPRICEAAGTNPTRILAA